MILPVSFLENCLPPPHVLEYFNESMRSCAIGSSKKFQKFMAIILLLAELLKEIYSGRGWGGQICLPTKIGLTIIMILLTYFSKLIG